MQIIPLTGDPGDFAFHFVGTFYNEPEFYGVFFDGVTEPGDWLALFNTEQRAKQYVYLMQNNRG